MYIKSNNINVYPTAYRGVTSDSKVYDPESRMFTEKNISSVYKNLIDSHYTADRKQASFLINDFSSKSDFYDLNNQGKTVEFILGGYYFKINAFPQTSIAPLYAEIKLTSNTAPDLTNTSFKNDKLTSYESSTSLDEEDPNESGTYIFTGLKIVGQNELDSDSPSDTYYYLMLWDETENVPNESKFKFSYKSIWGGYDSVSGKDKSLDEFLETDNIHLGEYIYTTVDSSGNNVELKKDDASIKVSKIYNDKNANSDTGRPSGGTGILTLEASDNLNINKGNSNKIVLSKSNTVEELSVTNDATNFVVNGDILLNSVNASGNILFKTLDSNSSTLYVRIPKDIDSCEPSSTSASSPSILATRNWLNNTSEKVTLEGDKYLSGNLELGNTDKTKSVSVYSNNFKINPTSNSYAVWFDTQNKAIKSNNSLYLYDKYLTIYDSNSSPVTSLSSSGLRVGESSYKALFAEVYGQLKVKKFVPETQSYVSIADFQLGNVSLGTANNSVNIVDYVSSLTVKKNANDNFISLNNSGNEMNLIIGPSSVRDKNNTSFTSYVDNISLKQIQKTSGGNSWTDVIKIQNSFDSYETSLINQNKTTITLGNAENTTLLNMCYGEIILKKFDQTKGAVLNPEKLSINEISVKSSLSVNNTKLSADSIGNLTIAATFTANGTGTHSFGGQVNAPSFNVSSDIRLKENLKAYEFKKSILDLSLYEYDLKSNHTHHIGCIAQDMQRICPEIVFENSDGYLSIEESKIVYLLLEEIKRLEARIKKLEV